MCTYFMYILLVGAFLITSIMPANVLFKLTGKVLHVPPPVKIWEEYKVLCFWTNSCKHEKCMQ